LQDKDASSLFKCDLIKTLGYVSAIILVIYFAVKGEIGIGVLASCLIAFRTLQDSMGGFLTGIGRMVQYLLLSDNYFLFMSYEEENMGSFKSGEFRGLKLENVFFEYPNAGDYALKNINLEVKKGENIAVVGANGSGKTTLSKLLLGVYSPEKGKVIRNGKDMESYAPDRYLEVSIVPQEVIEYNLNVGESLTFKKDFKAGENGKITAILKELSLDKLITDKGIHTNLGKIFGGKELSGGEWQKLAMGRCLYKEGEFLVLDEPTSAIDPVKETEIFNNFISMSRGKTSLIITHRLGICRFMDRIIVMNNGEIAEDGDHDTLIEKDSLYREMYESQSDWLVYET